MTGYGWMEIRFHIDPVTEQPHIYNHGVSEEEAAHVLMRAEDDLPSKTGTRIALGQTADGRYLQVVYVEDSEPGSVFVITAFDLRGKPLKAFRRRRRRRR
jgi:hypothetical protein